MGDGHSVGDALAETPPLRLRTKLAFGIGSAAETIALFSLSSYGLLYYNQVLGLPGWMAGLAISLSFVIDGFADPIIRVPVRPHPLEVGPQTPLHVRRPDPHRPVLLRHIQSAGGLRVTTPSSPGSPSR